MRRWLATAMLVAACAPAEQPGARAPAAPPASADSVYRALVAAGTGRTAVRATLGAPAAVDTTLAPNRHVPEATDTLITWRYGARRYEFLVSGATGGEFLTAVRAEGEGAAGLRPPPGTEASLIAAWGAPDYRHARADTTDLVWDVGGEAAPDALVARLVRDTVVAVVAHPYVD